MARVHFVSAEGLSAEGGDVAGGPGWGTAPAMDPRNMNLPRGPDNLCFDKDEFMKVRRRRRRRQPGPGGSELGA